MKREGAPLSLGIQRSTPELKRLKSPPPQLLGPPHDLAPKTYIFDLWAVNVTLSEARVFVEVRAYDIETGTLKEQKKLGLQTLLPNRTTELLADIGVDQKTAVQALMMTTTTTAADENDEKEGSHVLARASDWPQPLKHVMLSQNTNLTVTVLDGRVELRADAPVKGVEVYLADDERNIVWDDNGVDVFPGDVYEIRAEGLVKGDDVRVRYYGSS